MRVKKKRMRKRREDGEGKLAACQNKTGKPPKKESGHKEPQ